MNSQLVDYLLGRLPQNERDEISGCLFTDPDVLDELESVEADLIDDYVRGRLPQPDAELVSTRLLAGKRGAVHECLATAFTNQRPARRASRAWLWIGSAAAAILLGLYGITRTSKSVFRATPSSPAVRAIATVVLDLSATRGSARVQQVRLQAPRDVRFSVRSNAAVPEDSRILVHTPAGRDLSFAYDSFVIGTADLVAGRYQVEISSHSTLVAAGEFDVVFE
jgi:hypothetical protein